VRVRVRRAVFADLTDALVWYLERNEEAGERFQLAFGEALARMRTFPESGAPMLGLRRFRMVGFPYSLWLDPETTTLIALRHDARDTKAVLSRLHEETDEDM
jgi:plasmid stabilization system protein ParE